MQRDCFVALHRDVDRNAREGIAAIIHFFLTYGNGHWSVDRYFEALAVSRES